MLPPDLRRVAQAQVRRWRAHGRETQPAFARLLAEARRPEDVRRAVLRERPVLDASRDLNAEATDLHALREESAAAGTLEATPADLAFRRLYPALDLGVYACSHAVGKPSIAVHVAVEEHLRQAELGMGAWSTGDWALVFDDFRRVVAALVGADLDSGDVMTWPNLSEALCASLSGLSGRLVTTEDHFTTAHYAHEAWAARTGSAVVRVPVEADETVATGRLLDALTADTAVVSLSTASYRTGFLHDLRAVSEAMSARCPDAALVIDGYQTLGTVPFAVRDLPPRTAVLGGGGKQLRAGTGTGFGWFSTAFLERMVPDRTGWWAHRDPFAFSHGPMEAGPGAARLRTGVPSLAPMVALTAELRALSTSAGGDLGAAIARARRVTRAAVTGAMALARELGMEVAAGDDPDRKAAFFALRVEDGAPLVAALAEEGVFVDFRADPGAISGVIRLSSNPAGFPYELMYAVERLAARARP